MTGLKVVHKSTFGLTLPLFSETLVKVLTFQKAMAACDCTPQEMSRVIRIINEILRNQAPTPIVCRMIQVKGILTPVMTD